MSENVSENKKNKIEKNEEEKTNEEIINGFDYLGNAASTQDCTGLIPSYPVSREEWESYEDIFHYLPPKNPTDQ